MEQTILIPVDFSNASRLAARAGAAIGARLGATPLLVHVVAEMPVVDEAPAIQEAYEEAVLERAKAELGRMAADLLAEGHAVRTRIGGGNVVTRLLALEREEHAVMIAIGSTGHCDDEPFFLGSVTAALVRAAHTPILAIRHANRSESAFSGCFRRPLVAIDHSRFSPLAVALAARLSAPDATIELFHSLFVPNFESAPMVDRDKVYASVARYHRKKQEARLLSVASDLGIEQPVRATVAVGRAAERIRHHLDVHSFDLVVTGAHGGESSDGLRLGTVADRLLRRSKVPVLIIPEGALPSELPS